MNAPHVTASAGDATALLRRIERHVPFVAGRVVLALIRQSRGHVVQAAWIDSPPEIENEIRTGRADEGSPERLRSLVRDALAPLATTTPRSKAGVHKIAMVRCRRGRVVWLPADLAWRRALEAEADWHGLEVADCYLVTEYGWRGHTAPAAGANPALAA